METLQILQTKLFGIWNVITYNSSKDNHHHQTGASEGFYKAFDRV